MRNGSTTAPYIHHRIREQTLRTPDAIALVDAGMTMTYARLDLLSERLARHLNGLGVGPEERVGVLMGRSCSLIVTLLGILKSGAAFVPLDPDYPVERLNFMLEDAGADVLVAADRAHARTGLAFGGTVVDLADVIDDGNAPGRAHVPPRLHDDNLAYLTYTSGSTGRPKAVGIRHASAARLVASALATFTREELKGVLFGASICFDLAIVEIFVPLAAGGRVLIARNALDLAAVARRDEVTLVFVVPPVMAELLRQRAIPSTVRAILLGGEALTVALARKIREQTGVRRLFNLYGPSECTTYSTIAQIDHPEGAAEIAIGSEIEGHRCYVLDEALEPVAAGAPGELYIGGEGLARGYINRPRQSAERFRPDPFAAAAGQRMYRTGDVVRQRPDGQYVYIGRSDFQVKLRGYRIELGEIESVIEEDESIAQAIVLLRGDAGLEPRLVAHVTLQPAAARLNPPSQLARLRERLPDYMLPANWIELDHFPITANGKIDRAALALLDLNDLRPGADAPMPRTAAERRMAALWQDMLAVDRISCEDNFFALGGHSLTASRMLARIGREWQVELPLTSLFNAPTLSQFALAVEAAAQQQALADTPHDPVQPQSGRAHARLDASQVGNARSTEQMVESLETLSEDEVELLLQLIEQQDVY